MYSYLSRSFLVVAMPLGVFVGGISVFVARRQGEAPSFFVGFLSGLLAGAVIGLVLDWRARQNPDGWVGTLRAQAFGGEA
jgi:hypothetical protein